MENLKQYLEDSNEKFNSASIEEKKVILAEDVLLRLTLYNLYPEKGSLIKNMLLSKEDFSIKEMVNENSCEVCGKGALFCAYIGRVNKMSTKDYHSSMETMSINSIDNIFHRKLQDLFTPTELDLIEIAFEGESYLRIVDVESIEFKNAYSFHCEHDNPYEALKAIMENIIINSGIFRP